MVRISLPVLLILAGLPVFSALVSAAEQPFPYQATVATDQAEVRCGPGTQFYVTGVARQNETVTVHRHDHGGWYMISPPAGSFSLIEASLVEKTGGSRGTVSLAGELGQGKRAVVRIGSQVSDNHSFYGRELSQGDEVVIQGETSLQGPLGAVPMYKIAPPPQEFRWVKGESLIPQNQRVRQNMAADPYQIPPQHRQQLIADGRAPITSPVVPGLDAPPVLADSTPALPPPSAAQRQTAQLVPLLPHLSAPGTEMMTAKVSPPALPVATGSLDFDELSRIDQEYETAATGDPRDWRLEGVVARYRELEARTPENMKVIVRRRLEVAEQRLAIAERYQRFVQVSRETAQRDAELLAQQNGFQRAAAQSPEMPSSAVRPGMMPPGTVPFDGMQQANAAPFPTPGFPTHPQPHGNVLQTSGEMVPGSGQVPYLPGMAPSGPTAAPPSGPTQHMPQSQFQPPQFQQSQFQQSQFPQPVPSQTPYGVNPYTGQQPTGPMLPPQAMTSPNMMHPGMPHSVIPASGTTVQPAESNPSGFSGAGVLHRMQGPPNFPGYALVAPDGRLLAYVTAEQGVPLEQWLGRPVGVVGKRSPDPALGHDHIQAQKLVPVQLAR